VASAACPALQRGGKIEAGLMIERVCGDFLFQLGDRPDCLRLLGEIDRGLHGLDRGVVALGFRHHGQRLLGLLDRAGRDVAFRSPARAAMLVESCASTSA
jgi:hypothetical protein